MVEKFALIIKSGVGGSMLLRQKSTGHYVEVLDIHDLTNPFSPTLTGRLHWGEEPSDPELFTKDALVFVSGESLPECWVNQHFRDDELARRIIQPDQLRAH